MRKTIRKITLPTATCKQCKKLFFINQPIVQIQLGIPPMPIETCQDHE